MNKETVVNSIRELCKNHNITPTKLEEDLGFSQGLISRWKDKNPTLDRIIDIADYFHVTVDEVIGRGTNFNDLFLDYVYNKTNDKEIIWNINSLQKGNNKIDVPGVSDYYNEDTHTAISYYTKYKNAIFLINCLSKHYQTINPEELNFYIKPDDKSELVYQDYQTDQLKPLWLAILNNLDEEAPDEIKVENIKQQFVNANLKANFKELDYIKNDNETYNKFVKTLGKKTKNRLIEWRRIDKDDANYNMINNLDILKSNRGYKIDFNSSETYDELDQDLFIYLTTENNVDIYFIHQKVCLDFTEEIYSNYHEYSYILINTDGINTFVDADDELIKEVKTNIEAVLYEEPQKEKIKNIMENFIKS